MARICDAVAHNLLSDNNVPCHVSSFDERPVFLGTHQQPGKRDETNKVEAGAQGSHGRDEKGLVTQLGYDDHGKRREERVGLQVAMGMGGGKGGGLQRMSLSLFPIRPRPADRFPRALSPPQGMH
jgi:hypothetical protein